MAVLATYDFTKSGVPRNEVSRWFRDWYCGTCEGDNASVKFGIGRLGFMDSLHSHVVSLFCPKDGDLIQFIKNISCYTFMIGNMTCNNCHHNQDEERARVVLRTISNHSSVSACLEEENDGMAACRNCYPPKHVAPKCQSLKFTPTNHPDVFIFEHASQEVLFPDEQQVVSFKPAQQGHVVPVPKEFELEETFEFHGFFYYLISVCLFKDGNHYLSQALRENSSTGERSFRQINDLHQIYVDASGSTYSKSVECESPTIKVTPLPYHLHEFHDSLVPDTLLPVIFI